MKIRCSEPETQLANVIGDARTLAGLTSEEIIVLLGKLEELKVILLRQILPTKKGLPERPDVYLDVKQAAAKLNCSTKWLYKHLKHLPFVCR